MDINDLEHRFEDIYGKKPEHAYFAPGRVNLIGEHTDYNGGLVFPCALSFGTYLLVSKRDDDKCHFSSLNMEDDYIVDKDTFINKPKAWIKYPLGVMKEFADRGYDVWGYDILYFGDIPNRSGLSSSASIEVVTALMLKDQLNADFDMVELVKMSQKAENNYVGMKCGIMDQFAVGMGKTECAIALDCASLDFEYIPMKIEGYKIVIANTNKTRGLDDSKYNERRRECEEAVANISKEKKIDFLCELSEEQFGQYKHLIENKTVCRRARHAVSEHERVKKAIIALKSGDLETFGSLMNESHTSLKNDYEVTGKELDALAENAQRIDGVLGTRMTGAGFGGCTVSLVAEDKVDLFILEVGEKYKAATGLEATFYVADIGNGAHKIY